MPNSTRYSWQTITAVVWVAFVSAGSLKLIVPNVHWFFTAAVLALFSPRVFGARHSGPVKLTMMAGGLLVMAIVMVAPTTTRPGYQLAEAGKLAAIFLVITPVMLARPDTSRGIRLGAEFATVINGALVLAGSLGVAGFLELRAVGRYGTILNGPGSLWRVGILVLLPSALNLLMGRSFVLPLTMFVSSVALLVFDGSRTAALAIVIACGFIGYFMVTEVRRNRYASRKLLLRTAVLGLVLLSGIVWRPIQQAYVENISFGERFGRFFNEAETNGVSGVESVDEVRTDMLSAAIEAILEHPVVGSGMGSTAIDSPDGAVVVHDAYLQVWADVGILGLIGYVALTLGVLVGPWVRRGTMVRADIGDRIGFLNGVFILTCWAISGFLHPLSTEISEWVMFIVGISGLQIATSAPRARQAAFQFVGSRAGQSEMRPSASKP